MFTQAIKKTVLIIALFFAGWYGAYASQADSINVDDALMAIYKQYEKVKGVDCQRVDKGLGLSLLKSMLTKEFGKDFVKGVNVVIMISYGNAPEEVCHSIRESLNSLTPHLEEFNLGGEQELSDSQYAKCFAQRKDKGSLSGFLMVLEDKSEKMIMYMGGEIKVE